MKIGRKTVLYDSESPHWDLQHNFRDGTFVEYGGHGINRWDYRITNVIVSEYPRALVSIAGRCASQPGRKPEFLSVRIGAMPPKYVALSIKSTAFLHINSKGILTVSRHRISTNKFHELWGNALKDHFNTSAVNVVAGILSIRENTEPSSAGDSRTRAEAGLEPPER